MINQLTSFDPQNIDATTRMLTAMKAKGQLQSYVAQHRNSPEYPYLLALATSINNISSAEQAARTPMDGPKVADQALAALSPAPAPAAQQQMPEDVGIGQLPAKNLQGMAAGGIVAFGDGGEVPRYQVGGMPSAGTMYSIPGMVSQGSFAPQPGSGDEKTWAQKKLAELEQKVEAGTATPQERAWVSMFGGKPKTGQPAQPMQMGSNLGATDASLGAAGEAAVAQRGAPQPTRSSDTASSTPTPTPTPPNQTATNPYAITSPSFKPGEGLGFASSPTTMRSEMEAFMPQGQAKSPFEAQIRAAGAKELEGVEAYRTKREQQIKDLGLYGADQETRLKAREEKLKGQESELGPLALLQAGFAMMSGSSPFALQNIGIGAQTGLKHYAEGTERLQNAKEKLDDAYGRLEIARRSEKMLTQKEQAELERDANKVKTQIEKDVLNAAQQAYGLDRQDARTLFQAYNDNARAKAEATSRERLGLAQIAAEQSNTSARIQAQKDIAAMLPGEARTAIFLGEGKTDQEKYFSGAKRIQEATADKTGMAAVKLLTEANAKREEKGMPPLTMDDLIRSAREYSALMYPKVADVQNTRARPQ